MPARRVERHKPMSKAQADRLQRALRMTFARNLLAAREKAELSQQALGDLADISPNYLGRAERAADPAWRGAPANVTLDVVARLAAVLGTTPANLLSDFH
jgi:transcriptional regulator with XRE-family HTH domain